MNGLFIIVDNSEGGGGPTDETLFRFLFPKPVWSESLRNIRERGDTCFHKKGKSRYNMKWVVVFLAHLLTSTSLLSFDMHCFLSQDSAPAVTEASGSGSWESLQTL